MPRTALVVSGGSSKGAFAVGAAQSLRDDYGVGPFDMVAGTSTGAIIAPLAALGRLDELERLYTSFETTAVFIVLNDALEIFRRGYLLDSAPLRATLNAEYSPALFNDLVAAGRAGKQMIVTACELQSGRVTYFHIGPPPAVTPDRVLVEITSRELLVQAVMASAMQPVLMPLEVIDGRQYCDGGVRETAPIDVVVGAGATDVYAVVLTAESEAAIVGPVNGLVAGLERTIDLFTQEVVRDDMASPTLARDVVVHAAALRAALVARFPGQVGTIDGAFASVAATDPYRAAHIVQLHIIRPKAKLLDDSLHFTRDDMRRMVGLGRERVQELFGAAIPDEPRPIIV